jgi:hypothetical protein
MIRKTQPYAKNHASRYFGSSRRCRRRSNTTPSTEGIPLRVHPAEKDAFDLWEVWATKDHATDFRTIPAKIHSAVMMLTPEYSKDRAHQRDGAHTNESITSGRGCGPIWAEV